MKRAITVIGVILMSASAHAELLSEHNEQHAAIQAGANRLFDAGCVRVEWPRTERFTLHDAPGNEFKVVGNALTIRCTKWAPGKPDPVSSLIIHDLTWQRPTTRTDHSVLPADQIRGYALEIDGQATDIGNVLSYAATYSAAMVHTYRIRTIDTHGQRGPWSVEVRL